MLRLFFGLLATASFSHSALAAPKMEAATYPSFAGRVEIAGYFFRPPGEGPFPAVIGMHGCGGLFEDDNKTLLDTRIDWAERMVKAGYVLIYPDSYKSRGYGSVCEIKPEDLKVRLPDQVGDLTGTVDWLLKQSFVDPRRIGLIGWGTGGTAVMRVLDPAYHIHKRVDFAAAVAIYPQCDFLEKSTNYTPVIPPVIHSGAADKLAPAAPCKALSGRWKSPMTAHAGAYHNFDAPNAPVRQRRYASGVVYVGTNKAARESAIKDTMQKFSSAFAAAKEKESSGKAAAEDDSAEAAQKSFWKGKAFKAKQ